MKHSSLFFAFVLLAGVAVGQSGKKVPQSQAGVIDIRKHMAAKHVARESGVYQSGAPLANPSHQDFWSGKTDALNPTLTSRASNAFSVIDPGTNQIAVDDVNDDIFFIHRQNIVDHGGTPSTTSNGVYRIDYNLTGGSGAWKADVGPLTPLPFAGGNPARGRYPQLAVRVPAGVHTPDDLEFVFIGPTTNGQNWGNYIYGTFENVTTLYSGNNGVAGTNATLDPDIEFNFLTGNQNSEVLIPSSLTYANDNGGTANFYSADIGWNPTAPNPANPGTPGLTLDYTRVSKYSVNAGSVTYSEERIQLAQWIERDPALTNNTNTLSYFDPMVAFAPDGQTGWYALAGDWDESKLSGEPDYYAYEPVLFNTTDGGQTWNGPFHVSLRDYRSILDTIRTVFVDSLDNPVDTVAEPTIGSISLTVDANGNPHVFARIINRAQTASPDSAYFISTGGAKVLFDITTTDGGQSFCPKYVAAVGGFRSTIPGTDVSHDNEHRITRSTDGNFIFYSWVDDTSAVGSAVNTNWDPDLWGRARRVSDDAQTEIKNFSFDDPTYAGRVYFPQIAAPNVMELNGSPGTFVVPTFFIDIPQTELNPVNFLYTNLVRYEPGDFVAPVQDIAVNSVDFDGIVGNIACNVSSVQLEVELENVGSQTASGIDLTVFVSGSQDTVYNLTVPSNIAVGATQNFTTPVLNLPGPGAYNFTVVTQFDRVCENNIAEGLLNNIATTGNILAASTIDGCGSVVVNAGVQPGGGTTVDWSWTPLSGSGTASGQQVVLTQADIASPGVLTVTVNSGGVCPVATDNITVTINSAPAFTLGDTAEACAGDPAISLTANTANPAGVSYIWRDDAGAQVATSNTYSLATNAANSGAYTVEATITSTGCTGLDTVEALIWGLTASFSLPNNGSYCNSENQGTLANVVSALNSTTLPGTIYAWTIDGAPGPSTASVSLERGTKTYAVSLTDPLGCNAGSPATGSVTLTLSDSIGLTTNNTFADNGLNNPSASDTLYYFKANIAPRQQAGLDDLTPIDNIEWSYPNVGGISLLVDYPRIGSSFGGLPISQTTVGNFAFVSGTDSLGLGWCREGNPGTFPMEVVLTIESGGCVVDETYLGGANTRWSSVTGLEQFYAKGACVVARADELGLGAELTLYPNPSSGIFHVDLALPTRSEVRMEVVDMQGRTVQTRGFAATNSLATTVDLSELPAGIYMLQVATSEGTVTQRVVKQ